MNIIEDQSRQDFERFHAGRKSRGVVKNAAMFDRHPEDPGAYRDDSVQRHWWTWQNAKGKTLDRAPSLAVDVDTLTDLIASHLRATYHCTRVWEAWHVGTMSVDDFEPVDESDTPREIAEAVAALFRQKAEDRKATNNV